MSYPVKLPRKIRNKTLSNFWLLVSFFLTLLPTLIFAQINVTEYATFVAGTDSVNGAASTTPPNVYPDVRADHGGFYERTQKCYYFFGGRNALGNSGYFVS